MLLVASCYTCTKTRDMSNMCWQGAPLCWNPSFMFRLKQIKHNMSKVTIEEIYGYVSAICLCSAPSSSTGMISTLTKVLSLQKCVVPENIHSSSPPPPLHKEFSCKDPLPTHTLTHPSRNFSSASYISLVF